MARKRMVVEETTAKIRPALSEEARESQLIALAMDEVERRIRNHTATSQETTHFLRRAAQREKEKLEIEKLRKENELLVAKTEALQSAKRSEELFADAIKAFGIYTGKEVDDDSDEDNLYDDRPRY